MVQLNFQFLARRYHATPWGHQVNEGGVEWPPSPWRLLRAVVSAWHRLGQPESEETARSLVGKLARSDPHFRAPPFCEGHTRHYMPEDDTNPSKRKLVFDAFIQFGEESVLEVTFPGVTLSTAEDALLRRCVAQLGYLGRAESWVEATVGPVNVARPERMVTIQPGRTPMARRLMGAMDPREYADWSSLARKRIKKKAEKPPKDLWDALRMGTTAQQRGRWSRPPGSRDIPYDLGELTPRRVSHPNRKTTRPVRVARFALVPTDTVLPPLHEGLRIAEALHDALAFLGGDQCVPMLTGKRGDQMLRDEGHAYLLWTAERAGRDQNRVSHIHVALPTYRPKSAGEPHQSCFSPVERDVLERLRFVNAHLPGRNTKSRFETVLEGTWTAADVSQLIDLEQAHPTLSRARVWETATPVVLHRHPKQRHGAYVKDAPLEQVERYLKRSGFPPVKVEMLPHERRADWVRFKRRRSGSGPGRHGVGAFGFRLTFERDVQGPIAIGALAHFGLGRFEPVR